MALLLSLLAVSVCAQADACDGDVFAETIWLPMDRAQKPHVGIGMDRRGEVLAMVQRTCGEQPLEPCEDRFRGWFIDCRGIAVSRPVALLKDHYTPRFARAPGGDICVIWANETCVQARAFKSDGAPIGDRQTISPDPCGGGTFPFLYQLVVTAVGAEEEYVVAWGEQQRAQGSPATFRVRKVNHSGVWTGQDFVANPRDYPATNALQNLSFAGSISVDRRGIIHLVTTYGNPVSPTGASTGTAIVWRLTSDLQLIGTPIVVTEAAFTWQSHMDVDDEGRFVVAWIDPGDDWLHHDGPFIIDRIVAQRFDRDAKPVGELIVVTPEPLRSAGYDKIRVLMRRDGKFVIAFEGPGGGAVFGQRFTADGVKIGRRFQVNVSGPAYNPLATNNREDHWAVIYAIGSDAAGPEPHTVATRILNFNALEFIRGDANNNDVLDLSDAIAILDYLFQGGAPPPVLKAADVNDDEAVNVSDPVYLLIHLFLGGKPPPHPYPIPGFDPTE